MHFVQVQVLLVQNAQPVPCTTVHLAKLRVFMSILFLQSLILTFFLFYWLIFCYDHVTALKVICWFSIDIYVCRMQCG